MPWLAPKQNKYILVYSIARKQYALLEIFQICLGSVMTNACTIFPSVWREDVIYHQKHQGFSKYDALCVVHILGLCSESWAIITMLRITNSIQYLTVKWQLPFWESTQGFKMLQQHNDLRRWVCIVHMQQHAWGKDTFMVHLQHWQKRYIKNN